MTEKLSKKAISATLFFFFLVLSLNAQSTSETLSSSSIQLDPGPEDIITNSIGMKLRLISSGTFLMGSEIGEEDELPSHQVVIAFPFYIGICEVTQKEFETVLGNNPSQFKGPNRPVENVSFEDAKIFCKKLSEKEGSEYRLPTEEEWEYACRAGTTSDYFWGEQFDENYCWGDKLLGSGTRDVGQLKPNSWGLFDMSGNVWEWCQDIYRTKYESGSPVASGSYYVLRGGAWDGSHSVCRSSYRGVDISKVKDESLGFRVIKEIKIFPKPKN